MPLQEGIDGGYYPGDGNGYHPTELALTVNKEQELGSSFSGRPWVDYTMEVYLMDYCLSGGGGLGIVKGDTAIDAKRLGRNFTIFSLFYPFRMTQRLDQAFYQQDLPSETVNPRSLAYQRLLRYQWLLDTTIKANGDEIKLGVYKVPDLSIYLLHESGLQYQYPGENHIDHRLYQDAVLGFGGFKARQALGLNPAVVQIDEAPTALVPLAETDYLCKQGMSLREAKEQVRSKTLFTNHTLVNAAEASFTRDQLENYVIKNLETDDVKEWLQDLIRNHGGRLNLSTLAIELSGVRNGVSKVHAQFASQMFKEEDGSPVEFHQVTNGISERWVQPELLRFFKDMGIFKEDFSLEDGYEKKVDILDPITMRQLKDQAKTDLREYLTARIDQCNQPVVIPEGAKIACWTKRIAGYKRPEMLYEDPQRLVEILEAKNIHIILSGKAHPTDQPMKEQLQRILQLVDSNPVLKERVHFIQNYDEELAKYLVAGIDIGFNTPRVKDDDGHRINTEADGTFWKKLMANLAILISTRDGGVADFDQLPCFEVTGDDYQQEVASLYSCLEVAADEIGDLTKWQERVKNQLRTYAPTISGPRMIREYDELMESERRAREFAKELVRITP